MSMEHGPGPKPEFSLEAMLELAKDPQRRAQARLAIEQRKEELARALADVKDAVEHPGRRVSGAEWEEESARLTQEIAALDGALVQLERM